MSTPAVERRRDSAADRSATEQARMRRIRRTLVLVAALAIALVLMYQFAWVVGDFSYAMGLRVKQVGALVVVGISVGVASVVFQTIAGSRILTPGVMGFDAMYMLVQTVIVFFLGSATFILLPTHFLALINTAVLTGFGLLLFGALFRKTSRNLLVLVLIGVVLGALFSSLTSLASRLLSPDDFLTLQDVMFASFNTVNSDLLIVTAVVTAAACGAVVPLVRYLDAVSLGYERARCLGVPYHRIVRLTLVIVTVLVATSTALVGPMTFLGLIVANLARQLLPTFRHALLIPAAALIGIVCTVAGQLVVARVFHLGTTLSVVVNLVGGIYFIVLVARMVKL